MILAGVCRSTENIPRWCRFLTIQGLFGHKGVSTMMIYTHVLHRRPTGIRSLLDSM